MTDAAKGTMFFWLTLLGGGVIVMAVLSPFLVPPRHSRPPFPVQREQQRKIVLERVRAAGGWEVLRLECLGLLTNAPTGFRWRPSYHSELYNTNIDFGPLPPALASLVPREIVAYAFDDEPPILRMNLFGAGTTGSRGIPYYDLWFICGPAPAGFIPQLDDKSRQEINPVADLVFEVYEK